jgi:hypothetical protein
MDSVFLLFLSVDMRSTAYLGMTRRPRLGLSFARVIY